MKIQFAKSLLVTLGMVVGFALLVNISMAKSSFAAEANTYYTCPMPEHADVVMDKPGKCPKCGMTLVEKKKEQTTKYICPMAEDSDVVMDKPGKCPKCGMNLVPAKPEKK